MDCQAPGRRLTGNHANNLEKIMYFDRFDICEAYYLALSHCHGGQWSREYARLSRMGQYFKPSPMLSVESLSDNARVIYDDACARMLGVTV